jgi:hypothetical protein
MYVRAGSVAIVANGKCEIPGRRSFDEDGVHPLSSELIKR